MAKIMAPNKKYTGVSASVSFVSGVGESDSPDLLAWFSAHGYTVSEEGEPHEAPEGARDRKTGGASAQPDAGAEK